MSKKSSDQEDEDEDADPVPTPTTTCRLLTKTPEKTKSQCPASETPSPGIKYKKTMSQRPASTKPTTKNHWPAFPGVPKKKVGPMQLECMAIYTDINSEKWRVKRHGERKDKAFSFKSDAAENWDKLRVYVMGG